MKTLSDIVNADFFNALVRYTSFIRQDYHKFSLPANANVTMHESDIACEMDIGSKYLRIWTSTIHGGVKSGRSSHSFIVLKDVVVKDLKGRPLPLHAGDILKCATWHAPSLNFVRGNILSNDYGKSAWTGAN